MPSESLDEARERLRPSVEASRHTSCWSFPVHARQLEQRAWDFDARVRDLMHSAHSVLDVGTGGGERFGAYCRAYAGYAVATEGWPPNAPVASAALRPLGIDVVLCHDEALPFAGASFDLVLNRHSALTPADVARVLKPGGTLLTEQVWDHWRELKRFVPRMVEYRGLESAYHDGLTASGMAIVEARGHVVPAAFDNLGDFVFMLCVTPWTVPDFDPLGADLLALLQLERELTTPDGLVLSDGAYLIEARKPF